ncbi:MAG: hypothetical protein ACM4D3_02285 [Candidatus Sericytochromatia bacterium]
MAAFAIASGMGSAAADANNPALNGRYLATSNGELAMTNQSFHDEATTQSVWTITSSCGTPQDCTGTVTSDEGWTADILVPFRGQVASRPSDSELGAVQ